jgi:hypothetical protein
MTERSCGGCTACCKALPIAELDKPSGRWCTHCDKKRGCRIYDERPAGCRDFKCQWLLGSVFTDEERPDKVRIVVDSVEHPTTGTTIYLYEMVRGELAGDFAQRVMRMAFSVNFCVVTVPVIDALEPATLYLRSDIRLRQDDSFVEENRRIVLRRYTNIAKGAPM